MEMIKMTGAEIVNFFANANNTENVNNCVAKAVKRFGVNADFKTEVTEGKEVFVSIRSGEVTMTPCVFEHLWVEGFAHMERTEDNNTKSQWVRLLVNLNWRWSNFNGGTNGTEFVRIEVEFCKYRNHDEYSILSCNCNFYQSVH